MWRSGRCVAMLLQDTAQAGPETVPFANAAACIQAYRLGMSRPRGGMQALVEGIGQRFAAQGGDLRTATLVDRVEIDASSDPGDRHRRRASWWSRAAGSDCTLARSFSIFLSTSRPGCSADRWWAGLAVASDSRGPPGAAFTGYLAIDRSAVPDDSPLFHQVLLDL